MEGPLLITPYHVSYLDPEIVACAMPRALYFMAKEELFHKPILGALIRSLDAFPVRRGENDTEAIRKAIDALKSGKAVLVFPEGTRGDGKIMGSISPGIAMLAKRTNAQVLPVGIAGTHLAWPRGGKLRRVRMIVAFGKPFTYNEVAGSGPERENRERFVRVLGDRIAEQCALAGLPIKTASHNSNPKGFDSRGITPENQILSRAESQSPP